MQNHETYFGSKVIEDAEDAFYTQYLEKAIGYINGETDGVHMKQMSVACGNIAKMRQSRGSMAMLKYKIDMNEAGAQDVRD